MVIPEVTDLEIAFGTTKHLPTKEEIPKEFWRGDTKWNKLFSQLFFKGGKGIKFKFKEGTNEGNFYRWYKAHACSFEPSHERKDAGVAYFMSQHLVDWKKDEPTD